MLTPRAGQLELSIDIKDGTLGRVVAEGLTDGDGVREIEGMIVSLLAGYAAEVRLNPNGKKVALGGASSDFVMADEHLTYLDRNASSRLRRKEILMRRAHRFVKDHWVSIGAVANLVLELKRITGNGTVGASLAALAVEASSGDREAKNLLAMGLALHHPELQGTKFALPF